MLPGRIRRQLHFLYKWRHFPVDMVVEPFITVPQAIHRGGYGLTANKEILGEDDTTAYSQHFTSVWDKLSEYMGLENIYYDIYDRPEFLHACMRRITDATIAGVKNELRIHDDIANTCHCSYIYTDDLLSDCGAGKGTTSDNCWAFGLAQLFTQASPAVTEEFELPYIQDMAKHFHSIYYGCCDRLDDRMDVRETMSIAKRYGVQVELIQKDISTVMNQPERLTRWAEIAMEEAMNC